MTKTQKSQQFTALANSEKTGQSHSLVRLSVDQLDSILGATIIICPPRVCGH